MSRRYAPKGSPMSRRLELYRQVTESGCWEWDGCRDPQTGYGRIRVDGSTLYSHRVSYETYVGPIPDGLHIDHLCRNRACFNPDHLEPVTHAENVRRGVRTQMTHCRKGHPFDEENTRLYRGRRVCVTCNKQRCAEWRETRKGTAA